MTHLICYRELIKNAKDKVKAREELKQKISFPSLNVSEASRILNCSRNTVKKLLKEEDLDYESKKKTLQCPHKLSKKIEESIIIYHKEKGYGPDMIKLNLNLPHSTSTIYRILKQNGLVNERRKRYIRRKQVYRIKKKLKVFEKWQLDTKYLTDIPNLVGPIQQGIIPKYEYTLRDMRTGTTFVGYGLKERSLNDTCTFTALCLYHMQLHGIDTHYVVVQCDNGPENLGNVYQKKDYELQKIVEKQFKASFTTIPFRSPTFNSHVESFHGRIETELYDMIEMKNEKDFLKKARKFQLEWNTERKSLSKKRTPQKLARECGVNLDNCFYDFPILIYDKIPSNNFLTGQYLPDEVNI